MKILIRIIVVISFITLAVYLYGELGHKLPHDEYAIVEVHYPDSTVIGIGVMEIPNSYCEEALEEMESIFLESCKDCPIAEKRCYVDLPEPYWGVFEGKWIGFPYVMIGGEHPLRLIMANMRLDKFDKYCTRMYREYEQVKCIYN